VHLTGVSMREATELQVNQHQAPQASVIEDEVHPEPVVAYPEALLAANEAEISSQLQYN
jgi:hypothetical protein